MRTLLRGTMGVREFESRIHQGDMRKGLRKIAQLSSRPWVVLLCKKANVIP